MNYCSVRRVLLWPGNSIDVIEEVSGRGQQRSNTSRLSGVKIIRNVGP